jgi:hypothetical protein
LQIYILQIQNKGASMQNLQIVDEANALFLGKFKKFSSLS